MPGVRLTQRRVHALRPSRKVRDVRDAVLKGYGVRVMPSGARRYFIHAQHRGRRVWKIVGDAETVTEAEARSRARSMLAALRDGRDPDAEAPGQALFETVAEGVFARYGRRWKPGTLKVNRIYLRQQILPFFEGRPIGAITRGDVQSWFRSLHATPAAANRSAPILSVIMRQAEAWGYRPEGSNPCKGIRRYRQGRSERRTWDCYGAGPAVSRLFREIGRTWRSDTEIGRLQTAVFAVVWAELHNHLFPTRAPKAPPCPAEDIARAQPLIDVALKILSQPIDGADGRPVT